MGHGHCALSESNSRTNSSYVSMVIAEDGTVRSKLVGKPLYSPRTPSSAKMILTAWKMPLYLNGFTVWFCKRVRMT